MQTPRNPSRRNRNIGTSKQGHGEDNSLVVPSKSDGIHWTERIANCEIEDRQVAGRTVRFIVETNSLNCIHPCTVSDVAHILSALPQSDYAGLHTIVFRQPTRKQLTLFPAWGRLLYYAEIATEKGRVLAKGPAIFLDAVEVNKKMTWSTSLDPDDQHELERLTSDGHIVQRSGRKYNIAVSAQSARNTQLYRTLLHEIGHWFDWLSKVDEPSARGGDREELEANYFARPKSEREAFAHRYADRQRDQLTANGFIPFHQIN